MKRDMKPDEELRRMMLVWGGTKWCPKGGHSFYYYYRLANPKPKAIGHTRRASAATCAGPTKVCSLVLYQTSHRFILP